MAIVNATVKDMMTTEVVAVRRETAFKEMAGRAPPVPGERAARR